MTPISTGSGKSARANIDALRQRRIPVLVERTDETIEALESLADQSYALLRALRDHVNAVRFHMEAMRPLAIAAKQLALKARKARKIDLEL